MRTILGQAAACTLTLLLAHSVFAKAEDSLKFHIAAQPMVPALKAFADQATMQLLYMHEAVESATANPVIGSFEKRDALTQLLRGTKLEVVFIADDAAAIRPKSDAAATTRGASVILASIRLAQAVDSQSMGSSASAEAPAAASADVVENLQEIVVTGSLISRAGFTAPTPVTTVDPHQLNLRPQLAESLRELPALRNSFGPQTHFGDVRSIGRAQMNLRNMGPQRTLVLLNGQRFVTSLDNGAPDVALFPTALVDRVEIVTGGASAAYGSDAVAGVVNFILDKDFTGLKAGLSSGISERGDNKNRSGNLAYGAKWGSEDRGHVLMSYEASHRDGMLALDRSWARRGVGLITYSDQTPPLVRLENVRRSDLNENGVIASGPLRGTSFTANGLQRPFVYGTGVTGTNMIGGEGPLTAIGNLSNGVPVDTQAAYARLSYEVAPSWTVFAEANYGVTEVTPDGGYNYLIGAATAPRVQIDNAYLDPALRGRMVTAGLQSFQINKQYDFGHLTYDVETTVKRAVAGVEGQLGRFKTDAYVTYGENDAHNVLAGMINLVHLHRAADAVVNPASGQVVCRSTLTDPTNGCVPYNIMALAGANNPAAIDYIRGDLVFDQITTQFAGGVTFSGDLFELPAGPLAAAFGGEFRRETYEMNGDELSQRVNPITGAQGWWRSGSAPNVDGSSSSKGIFTEVAVPVLKDRPFAESLDLNAAVRLTDYRLSGSVTTWKAGGTWDVGAGVRLRATRSRDIREPTLGQLYAAGGGNPFSLIDRVRGHVTPTSGVQRFTRGNLELEPEAADTWTYGVVLTPPFMPGFALSIDRYDIDIGNAIAGLQPQATVDECARGVQIACASLVRNPAGTLISIYDTTYNLATRRVAGYDVEARYRLPLNTFWASAPGALTFRALATYQGTDIRALPGATPINRAGETGIYAYPGEFQLKWRGTNSLTYSQDKWNATVSARYSGSGVRDVMWQSGVDIDNNEVPSAVYADLDIARDFAIRGVTGTVNFTINNVLDKDPLLVGNDASDTVGFGTNSEYDLIGRAFRLGMNFEF
jgi:iron complex outermembrane recepter protein